VAQARIECRDLGRGGDDLCRNLIRVWVAKYEAGAFDDDAGAADLIQAYEARIAALERLVGKQALELEFLRGLGKRSAHEKHAYIRHHRPRGLSIAQGCRLMGIARSTYYDVSAAEAPRICARRTRPKAVLRPLATRVRHAQLDPQQDHRRGHRLALPERDQARAEGVSHAGGRSGWQS
jgi:hypothetical protein